MSVSRRPSALLILAALLPLTACAAANEAIRGPKLTPVGDPTPTLAEQPSVLSAYHAHDESPRPASANSIWRAGARTFFNDQRAAKVGDILTVLITIDDSAQVQNDTTRERKTANTAGMTNMFGLETVLKHALPGLTPSTLVNTNGDSALTGTGTINRQEKINLTIAAVVTKVLPNGNLLIQGSQEVKTNNDLRELTVGGIVRPEDISSSNTINHTQIAEARSNYGGKGDMMRSNSAPAAQALMETFEPF
ncbi:MAG TPA: flagellar basal body L-ring protein FlgH [Caulobacteraceae bacterium]|nr:flagellar basal body L-ring protein FlgH [Caulobacteraceae bacterium]